MTLRATVGIILVGLGCLATSTAAEETIRLSVMYEGSKLSVEARGVSLTEVLRAIGTKVGFTVIDNGLARSPRGRHEGDNDMHMYMSISLNTTKTLTSSRNSSKHRLARHLRRFRLKGAN